MRRVAERIGYSATTIYHHFPDRDALLFAVVDDAFEGFAAVMGDAIRSASDAATRIAAMGRAYVRFALDHPAHYRLMFIQRADYLMGHGPAEERARIESLGVLEGVVAGSPAGRAGLVEPSAGADAVWAAVHGIAALATGVPIFDRPRAEAAAEAAITLLVGGLEG
jgi:AcrR family transcriptional regulator